MSIRIEKDGKEIATFKVVWENEGAIGVDLVAQRNWDKKKARVFIKKSLIVDGVVSAEDFDNARHYACGQMYNHPKAYHKWWIYAEEWKDAMAKTDPRFEEPKMPKSWGKF